MLTGDDTLALVAVSALASVVGQHRALGLLGLQEQRIEAVVGFYQQDPGFGADAAYADDLAGHAGQAADCRQRCAAPAPIRNPPTLAEQTVCAPRVWLRSSAGAGAGLPSGTTTADS
jgi:hypothetical protein